MMRERILLVDDEADILNLLEEVLRKEGFKHIYKAENGNDAVRACREHTPDAIVLDVMLPDIDGLEVCKQIRIFSNTPILFLSSKNDEIDKILGLSIGGDDYVTKPFSPKEMAYRIKAQLRRSSSVQGDHQCMQLGDVRIDVEANRVYKNDKEIPLTAREYGLLLYLAENQNKIISKERLYEQVWGEDSFGSENTLMVHIRHLREKIEDDPSAPRRLVTVKGLGYRLVNEDVR